MRAKRLAAAAAAVLGASVYAGSPAYADTTVRGTDFSGTGVELSFLGCEGIYERSPETVQPYVTNVAASVGERSLKFDLAGGNAVGGLSYFDSMAGAGSAAVSVSGPGGAAGVAYAGYQEPSDLGTSIVWIGRADVSGANWQSVSAVSQTYSWTKYDLETGMTLGTVPASTVGAMVAERGDGPGFYAIGFGCNGEHYYIDDMRFGGTTLNLEGYETWIAIDQVGSDDKPKISGTLTATRPLSDAQLVLERRAESGDWEQVGVFPAEVAARGVEATPGTTYRWSFLERPLADGSHSRVETIEVDGTTSSTSPASPAGTPSSAPESTRDPSESPTEPDAPGTQTPQKESTAQDPAPEEPAPEESTSEESTSQEPEPQEPEAQLTAKPKPSPLEKAPVQMAGQKQKPSPTAAPTPQLAPCASPTPDAASDAPADATDAASSTAAATEATTDATAATTEESAQDATAAEATTNC